MMISGLFFLTSICFFVVGVLFNVRALEEALQFNVLTTVGMRYMVAAAVSYTLGGACIVFSTPPI